MRTAWSLGAGILACTLACSTMPAQASNPNGAGGTMPAYYDGQLFTINLFELPSGGETSTLNRNTQINNIYMYDPGLPGGQMFISVLDAIQADGFNPLWQEVQITFLTIAPMQLTSDTQVDSLRDAGAIALDNTGEIYRCSVIGKSVGGANATRTGVGPPDATRRPRTWGAVKSLFR